MEKLNGQSMNLTENNIDNLKQLFPEVFSEGKIDFDKLRLILGDNIEENDERYQFTWNGKSEAIKNAQTPSMGTLRPDKESSKNWDSTENLYIEGDNLEVLKLLQKSYFGKVKMIYIDPPYNTGKDFVYKDNFRDSIANYKEVTNQTTKANAETSGRYHTDWLNMMYPRLKLARNLLREDGVIFISIDDNEVTNLKKLCDEIFGEENFVSILPTIMNLKGNNDQFGFSGTHEYTLVYLKNKSNLEDLNGIDLTEEDKKEYTLQDKKGFYKQGATLMRTGEAGAREKRPKGYYPIYVSKNLDRISIERINKDDYEVYPKTKDGKEMSWRRSRENLAITSGEFIVKENRGSISFYKKQRLEEDIIKGKKAKSLFYKPEYSSGNGTAIVKDLLDGRVFDNPKPIMLVKDFIKIGSSNDIVLDFFSGASTSAHAVMQLNAEDGGNRKFIMVQLPEVTDEKSEAYKLGYKNICEIAKERIRRAGEKVVRESGKMDLDIGFKVFKLDDSNIKEWSPNYDELEATLDEMTDNLKSGRTKEDLLFEILIKMGIELTAPIEEINVGDKKIYNVGMGSLILCLEYKNICEIAKERIRRAGEKVVRESGKMDLDIGFKVFKLDDSNIKEWSPNYDELEATLDEMTDNLKSGRTKEDLLFEILIKMGIELTAPIEEINVGDKKIYNVGMGSLILCLEDEITEEIIKEIPKYKSDFVDMKVVFKETGRVEELKKTYYLKSL